MYYVHFNLNVSPNYTLIWQKEITEKNVNWNSFWIRGHGAKFFTLTRFPLFFFFFSLYKTFIYACWCYKTRILMWNTSVHPGPELETILAIPISVWNQLENEGGQWVHWGPANRNWHSCELERVSQVVLGFCARLVDKQFTILKASWNWKLSHVLLQA